MNEMAYLLLKDFIHVQLLKARNAATRWPISCLKVVFYIAYLVNFPVEFDGWCGDLILQSA